jgi:threonine/homoserine/homoserine lactone efflux protein
MTFEHFIAYFIILFIATITPGPSMLLALSHGVNHGFFRTITSGLGNLLGNFIMALVSILGLGAILAASGFVFTIIKWGGVVYLIFLGFKSIIEPIRTKTVDENRESIIIKSKHSLFLDGFLIAIGNPKGILFFTALFPQFINVQQASISGLMIVFVTLGIVAFGCYMLYALCGVRLNFLFQSYSFRKLFNRISGAVFIGSGVAIAFSKK